MRQAEAENFELEHQDWGVREALAGLLGCRPQKSSKQELAGISFCEEGYAT